jgi:5,5'-dehydrodivanillate O-demethylase
MGNLLRRYWHPIAAATQLDENPVKKVRILGESLVLFRDRQGRKGLISDTCAHRRINLAFGIPEPEGLRCAYHGWLYRADGQCIEMPGEPEGSTFPSRVKLAAYPVQELCGLIFAYLGPEPAPLLPRWDMFVWDHVLRDIGFQEVPCNWFQMQENNVDPVHLTWLHGNFSNYVLERLGRSDLKRSAFPAQGSLHGWDLYENGIIKRSRPPGAPESDPHWSTGMGFLFPNLEVIMTNFQYRVPMDDTHTLQVYFSAYPQPPGEIVEQHKVPHYRVPLPLDAEGNAYWEELDSNGGQDALVWMLQGARADRTQERLGESDRGILIFRDMMRRQMDIVEAGGEPLNVIRDPAENVCIDVPRYGTPMDWNLTRNLIMRRVNGAWKYSPIVREMVEKYQGREALLEPIH